MKTEKLKGNIFLLVTAIIWGGGFIFQTHASKVLPAFSFNTIRMLVSTLTFIICYFLTKKISFLNTTNNDKKCLIFGIITGIAVFLGFFCQQTAITHITAAKSGFLTSTQVIFVPILAIFIKKKAKPQVWIATIIAFIGFYIMSMTEKYVPSVWDIITILGAVFFSINVLILDHVKNDVNLFKFGFVFSLTAGILSFIFSLIFDTVTTEGILESIIPALYLGIVSGAIATVCEILGHRYNPNPTIAILILSLESVFALIFGFIFLSQMVTLQEGIGCIIVSIAVILSQIDFKQLKLNKK